MLKNLFLLSLVASQSAYAQSEPSTWPILNDGLETLVEWDHFSLMFNGKRLFEFSGEFHPFRTPVPELWQDIIEKTKALGMNTVSFYSHWGYHASNETEVDFTTGGHDFERFFEYAKDVGVFVQCRPGPYVNGELSAGGMPLWVTTGAYGPLRNNNTLYTEAWTPYISTIADITQKWQVTTNGTALLWQIENEDPVQWENVDEKIPDPEGIAYFEKLEATARAHGINIPFFANAPNENGKAWSKDYDTVGAGGDVDIYGLDSYPSCWSCVASDCGAPIPLFTLVDYFDHFQNVSFRQPEYIPEFQGGALNPWYGPVDNCVENSDWDFENLYLRDNIAQKVSMISLYMIYGGTNWGWLAVPFVPTSYDYSAAIGEDRSLRQKYYEIKLLGLFIRVAEDLPGTWRNGVGTNFTDNSAILTTELLNANTSARFYVTRHATSTSGTVETFKLNVTTESGNFVIPQKGGSITLNGHVSKIIPTDFRFGDETLIYSTAEVLTYAMFDGKPTLAVWTVAGETGELYIKGAKTGTATVCEHCDSVTMTTTTDGIILNFVQREGMSVVMLDSGVRVLLMDRITAYGFWVPGLSSDPLVPVDNVALVSGPHLVRSASVSGSTISIRGDVNVTTTVEVFAAANVNSVEWNGKALTTTKTSSGSLQIVVPGPDAFTVPAFGAWKVQDSLPEISTNYSDTGIAWVDANHTSTVNSLKEATIPYLFVDEYGFHTGVHLWRGYFSGTSSSSATGVFLNVQGGNAFGFSAYLNGMLIGSFFGDAFLEVSNLTLSFANATVNNGENVLLVIQDNSGHDETDGATIPRGILNATLLGENEPTFERWKVAGTAGGAFNKTLDPLRTVYNEGGLFAERLGWHLPGFDDSSWASSTPLQGFTGATVKFYRTTLDLSSVPAGHDVSLHFTLAPAGQSTNSSAPFRAYLYVNGYQYGRYYPFIRDTNPYPVPPGVLNYNGENTIALAVWAQTEQGAAVELDLDVSYVVSSGLDFKFDSTYLRPGWTSERLQYA